MKRRVVAIVLSLTMSMGGTLEAGAAALRTPDVQVEAETTSDSAADSFGDEEETVQQPQTDDSEDGDTVDVVIPNVTETPADTVDEAPDITESPYVTETPDITEIPDATETPEEVAPLEKRVPCNIVSAYDAEITGVTVRSGQLLCAVKEPVQKGALLVSGVQLDEEGNIRFRHAMADIEGIYQIEDTFSCAYEQMIRTSSGREQTKTSLDFFTLELPLSKSQKPYAYGQTMTERTPLTIFGKSLPIAICQETNREYTETVLQFTPEEAKQDLEQQIQRYERNFLTDVEILEKQVMDTKKETALCSTVSYTLKGEIGISKEIFAKTEH